MEAVDSHVDQIDQSKFERLNESLSGIEQDLGNATSALCGCYDRLLGPVTKESEQGEPTERHGPRVGLIGALEDRVDGLHSAFVALTVQLKRVDGDF